MKTTLKEIIQNPRLINALSKKEAHQFIRDAIITNYEKLIMKNIELQLRIEEIKMGKWINALDELPPSGKEVLTYSYGLYKIDFWSHITEEWDDDEPEYWMYLPEIDE